MRPNSSSRRGGMRPVTVPRHIPTASYSDNVVQPDSSDHSRGTPLKSRGGSRPLINSKG